MSFFMAKRFPIDYQAFGHSVHRFRRVKVSEDLENEMFDAIPLQFLSMPAPREYLYTKDLLKVVFLAFSERIHTFFLLMGKSATG